MVSTSDISRRAGELKDLYLGLMTALPAVLHPSLPLLRVYSEAFGQPADAPIVVARKDGTPHSTKPLVEVLRRASALRGEVMSNDLMAIGALQGATRIGDMIDQVSARDSSSPLLEFARHLRNASAHGDRWHFQHGEPRHPAALRGRILDASLDGSKVMFEWLAPGDYLDFLDDIETRFA